jgi:hypothetical protein
MEGLAEWAVGSPRDVVRLHCHRVRHADLAGSPRLVRVRTASSRHVSSVESDLVGTVFRAPGGRRS